MSGKSPSLRRILADIRELKTVPSDRYYAAPLENDMFEWHFTIRGADDTDFQNGTYHGRILLPPDYPFKPPHIIFLTETGRFEVDKKVCLSFSAYHPELWQPAWGIRLILEALISFLPTPSDGAIGAIEMSSAGRKKLASRSRHYCCPTCGPIVNLIPKVVAAAKTNQTTSNFQKEIAELQRLQAISHPKENEHDENEKQQTKEGDQIQQQQEGEDGLEQKMENNNSTNASETLMTSTISTMTTTTATTSTVAMSTSTTGVNNSIPVTTTSQSDHEKVVLSAAAGSFATEENATESTINATGISTTIQEKKVTSSGQSNDDLTDNLIIKDEIINNNENNNNNDNQNHVDNIVVPPAGGNNVVIGNHHNRNVPMVADVSSSSSFVTRFLDPFLQGIIVLLTILCLLLLNKIQMLVYDINELSSNHPYSYNNHDFDSNEL